MEKPSNLPMVTQTVKWQNPQTQHSSRSDSRALPWALFHTKALLLPSGALQLRQPNLKSQPPAVFPSTMRCPSLGWLNSLDLLTAYCLLADVVCLLTAVCTVQPMGVCWTTESGDGPAVSLALATSPTYMHKDCTPCLSPHSSLHITDAPSLWVKNLTWKMW